MESFTEANFTEPSSLTLAEEHDSPLADYTPSLAVSVEIAIERKREKARFFREVMTEGQHYGAIPGTNKPTLLKPGAEMLLANMGMQATFENDGEPVLDILGKQFGEPFIMYNRKCLVYKQTGPGEHDRVLVACASGSCNSWEEKYRFRKAERVCPSCSAPAIIAGKAEYGGGFVCFKKKGGCGAKFPDDDPSILNQQAGNVPNPHVFDLLNTILKMADKRALVAATLIATGCSDIFTQDVEDMPQFAGKEPEKKFLSDRDLLNKAITLGFCEDAATFLAWASKLPGCSNAGPGWKMSDKQRVIVEAFLEEAA